MTVFEAIEKRLMQLGLSSEVLKRYDEPHRFYHTRRHLSEMFAILGPVAEMDAALFLAAVYHDAVYNPRSADNEEQSAAYFEKAAGGHLNAGVIEEVCALIMDTKQHKPHNAKSKKLVEADLGIFNAGFARLVEYEHQIFKEYQYTDFTKYREGRVEVLSHYNQNGRLDTLIEYVKQRRPSIGVFAGSFNPFHRGHYNVLQKAEKIFDKVIVAFGKNPEKNERSWDIPKTITNRQIESYIGLHTDFISGFGYEVVVVRGLRNSTDFQYEQNQYRYIQELMPGIKIINIFCDKEFEHISSSGIRTLEKFDKHKSYLLE